MAYTQKTKVQYSDSNNLDAFGRLRISDSIQIWEGKVVNGADWGPEIVNASTDTGGKTGWDFGANYIDLWIRDGSLPISNLSVIRESAYHLPYQSGRSSLCMFTFSGFNTEIATTSKVVKRIGLYHNTSFDFKNQTLDGWYFESSDAKVKFIFSVDGNELYSLAQDTWTSEDYDPLSIDWSLPQIGWIDYEWLGVGRIRFGLVIDGIPRKFGEFSLANDPNATGSLTPTSLRCNQKFRMELFLPATSTCQTEEIFRGYCQSFSIEGSSNSISRTYAATQYEEVGVNGQMVGLLGFAVPFRRDNNAYWSFANLDTLSFYTLGAASKPSILHVIYVPDNSVVNSLTWVYNQSCNLMGVTGTNASPLRHTTQKLNMTSNNIPYQIIASYPMTEGYGSSISPQDVLVRPGVIEDVNQGGNDIYGNIFIAVEAASNTTKHFISANWKCIT